MLTAIDTSPEAVEQLAMEYSYSHGMDLIVAATLRALSGELARAREAADFALNALIGCAVTAGGVDDRATLLEAQDKLRKVLPSQGPSHG